MNKTISELVASRDWEELGNVLREAFQGVDHSIYIGIPQEGGGFTDISSENCIVSQALDMHASWIVEIAKELDVPTEQLLKDISRRITFYENEREENNPS